MSLSDEYRDYCNKFNKVWGYLQSCSKGIDTITEEICNHRKYFDSFDKWKKTLLEVGVAYVSSDTCDYNKLKDNTFNDLALFNEDGTYFLVNERYIFPVKDMLGNVIALVGWYPDSKRYITTPSRFFSKDCLFFGMEQLGKTGLSREYFIVEGIFDCLSVRSLGLNAVAMMGINSSSVKNSWYGMFKRVVAVPDNDTQGRKVLQGDLWNIPRNGSYLRWVGDLEVYDEKIKIKDIDRLIALFEEDSVREMLIKSLSNKNRLIKIELS